MIRPLPTLALAAVMASLTLAFVARAAGPAAPAALVNVTSTSQPATNQSPEEQARAATLALLQAMADRDTARVNTRIAPDAEGPTGPLRDIFALVVAMADLEHAAYAKLGADEQGQFAMASPERHEKLQDQIVQVIGSVRTVPFAIDGDIASFDLPQTHGPVLVFEKTKAGYQLLEAPGVHVEMDIGRYHVGTDPTLTPLATQALKAGAAALNAGKVTTAKDTWKLMEDKMTQLLAADAAAKSK